MRTLLGGSEERQEEAREIAQKGEMEPAESMDRHEEVELGGDPSAKLIKEQAAFNLAELELNEGEDALEH